MEALKIIGWLGFIGGSMAGLFYMAITVATVAGWFNRVFRGG